MITPLQYIDELTDSVTNRVIKYTPQIFRKCKVDTNRDSPIEAIGSSVLLAVQKRYFLITAGHIIAGNEKATLGFFENSEFHIIDGRIIFTDPESDEASKYIDIAVCELDTLSVDFVNKHFSFLSLDSRNFDYYPTNHNNFLLVGYPWRKTHYNFLKKKMTVTPYKFLTDFFDDGQLGELHNLKKQNLILGYIQRRMIDFKTRRNKKVVTPEGMSGCGVWHLTELFQEDFSKVNVNLSGIIIRQDANTKRYVVAVRLHIISEILRLYFNVNLAPSKISRLEEGIKPNYRNF